MVLYYRQVEDTIIVSGKTYPYKEQIKALGGRFQSEGKVWTLPAGDEGLREIQRLCKTVGGGPMKAPKVSSTPSHKDIIKEEVQESTVKLADGFTVTELMAKISLHLESGFPQAIWVVGEIQGLSRRPHGVYFQLADQKNGRSKSATVTANVTLWQSNYQAMKVKFKNEMDSMLQDGVKVRCLVKVSFYKDRGSVSLNLLDLDASYTKGALALAREALMKELRAKGLDQKNKSLPGTSFPFRVGLISAPGSRAKSDFLDQLKHYNFPGTVLFHPANMQGEKTTKEVLQALSVLEQQGCDYVVITRGGGSEADLRWFDDAELAQRVAHSTMPIIAAIGHHEDVCVLEEIAHRREKTPTAAADFILSVFANVSQRIERLAQGMQQGSRARLSQSERHHNQLLKHIEALAQRFLARSHQRLERLAGAVQSSTHQQIARADRLLSSLEGVMKSSSQRSIANHQQYLQRAVYHLASGTQRNLGVFQQQAEQCSRLLKQGADRYIEEQDRRLGQMHTQLVAKNPGPWMQEGWTLLSQNEKRIKSLQDLDPQKDIWVRLTDGRAKLKFVSQQETSS